ncbi:hypothetical protein WUBG_08102, partial [Wuchereria bancrofti]
MEVMNYAEGHSCATAVAGISEHDLDERCEQRMEGKLYPLRKNEKSYTGKYASHVFNIIQ